MRSKSSPRYPGRKALAAHLLRIEVRHELPASERICGCGAVLQEIGAETSEQLDYIPAKIQVIRHVRPKYACDHCHAGVKIAPVPAHILPRSKASRGLLAHVVTSKFVDGLPFHRQQTVFARHDVALPRGTQVAWIISVMSPIMPLLNLMDERVRSSGCIRIDETPAQVLKSDKAPNIDHWMWVRVAARLLEGARGYLQSDGYAAYDGVAAQLQLTHVGCFAQYPGSGFIWLKCTKSLH